MNLLGGVQLTESEFNVRAALAEDRQNCRKDIAGRCTDEPDDQSPGLSICRALSGQHRFVRLREDEACLLHEDSACVCEMNAVFHPVEEWDPQLLLQFSNLSAERWLGHVQTLGRTAEVELLGDGDEVL